MNDRHPVDKDKMGDSNSFRAEEGRTLRFCVDYQKHSAINVLHIYAIPKMDSCAESLVDAVVFSAFEASRDSWHVQIEDIDLDKTIFRSQYRLRRFALMPSALNNTQAYSNGQVAYYLR